MDKNELKEDYTRMLDGLLYRLSCNKENTDLSDEEIFGYEMCISDVEEYFRDALGVSLK